MGIMDFLALGLAAAFMLLLAKVFIAKRSFLPADQIMELKQNGALIVDVRSRREFEAEHATGSLNIPLKNLQERISELDRERPILVCCASGTRSAAAAQMLQQAGFKQVHNAGPWTILR